MSTTTEELERRAQARIDALAADPVRVTFTRDEASTVGAAIALALQTVGEAVPTEPSHTLNSALRKLQEAAR